MKLLKIIGYVAFSATLLFSYSCRKEMEKAHWDTQVLAPIINTSLSINNVLPDSILQANADSSLKIVFEDDIFKLNSDSLFFIPDTTIKNGYNIPLVVTLTPGQTIFNNLITETNYNLKGVQLRKVIIKSGFVSFTIKNKIKEMADFTYKIPSAKLNNVPFTINITVPAAVGTTPGVFSQVYDLSGYEILLTGPANNKVNTIYTSLTAGISANGNPVNVTPADSLIIENSFFDIVPYYAKGYFGQNTIDIGPDSSTFTMFNKITNGNLLLQDAVFNIDIENPIGMDARVYINNLSSINTKKNTTVTLNSTILNSPININRASESGGIAFPQYANIALNSTNSNIKQLIENLPNVLGYTMQIQTNPLGNISGSNDFIYTDKLLGAKLKMEVPLAFVANDLTLADTLDFSISKEGALENVNYGTLTLFANNGYPMDATIQMYMMDENNVVKDSLFISSNTIVQAPVNASLKVTQKKLTKLIIPVDKDKMDLLFETKKMFLVVKLNTASKPQYVKIYSDYTMDIKLVADFSYSVYMQ